MARVHYRKARKDYPNNGIAKGDMYYFAQIKTGPRSSRTIRSLTRPTRSQLTVSDFFGQMYDLDDAINATDDPDELEGLAENVRELGQEQQVKLDNMPDGLQQGDTGQLIQERIDGCEEWAQNIDEAVQEMRDAADNEDLDGEETEQAIAAAKDNICCPF